MAHERGFGGPARDRHHIAFACAVACGPDEAPKGLWCLGSLVARDGHTDQSPFRKFNETLGALGANDDLTPACRAAELLRGRLACGAEVQALALGAPLGRPTEPPAVLRSRQSARPSALPPLHGPSGFGACPPLGFALDCLQPPVRCPKGLAEGPGKESSALLQQAAALLVLRLAAAVTIFGFLIPPTSPSDSTTVCFSSLISHISGRSSSLPSITGAVAGSLAAQLLFIVLPLSGAT